jgi:tryptophan halogenase
MPRDRQFTLPVMQELFTNHELLALEAARPKIEPGSPVRRVGVVGGGTAGWFTALALRAQIPELEITVIETPSVPIIGVGEASVPSLVSFLHHYLKLDVVDFTRAVKPTWKQGIRFEWGLPGGYAFQAPFDWEVNGVGMLGSMAETGNVSSLTLQGMLMERDVTPVIRTDGKLESFLPLVSFAYHLENRRLVAYLTETAIARGVKRLEHKIVDAALVDAPGDGDPRVSHLVTEGGDHLAFDLYVDCSGFRSLLLEQKLGEPFRPYTSTLYTDRALAFNSPHGGRLKAYTTARTMNHGWCWSIPMVESDHCGYVFSSAYCGDDEALDEARRLHPELSGERVVRFKSGRHERLWVGNVFAIGNAYAFVEPLESTGLLMITRAISSLVRAFPTGQDDAVQRRFVNTTVGNDWDRLRWFLGAHYKFNRRLDTRFWTDAREGCDISGLDDALALYRAMGPLSLLPRAIRSSVLDVAQVFFYGLAGLDCILLGQKVPHARLPREPQKAWRARRALALEFAKRALPQAEALKATWAEPAWLRQLVDHPSSWVSKGVAYI